MTQQVLQIGNGTPGSGDQAPVFGAKCNNNFNDLYGAVLAGVGGLTLAQLTAQYPPAANTGKTAYTTDQGIVYSNGTTWSAIGTPSTQPTGYNAGLSIGKLMTKVLATPISNPTTGLAFQTKQIIRPYSFIAEDYLKSWEDTFANSSPGDQWTVSGTGTTNFTGQGYLAMNTALNAAAFYQGTNHGAVQNPQGFCAFLDVKQSPADGGSNAIQFGFYNSSTNYLLVQYIPGGNLQIISYYAGSFVASTTTAPALTAPYSLGFKLENGSIWAYSKQGNGINSPWVPQIFFTPTQTGFVNALQTPQTLASWPLVIGVAGGSVSPAQFYRIGTGFMGSHGLRDYRIVTLADGTPYTSAGYLYFTATSSGSHCGIYKINMRSLKISKIGALYIQQSGNGVINFALNWHLVYDATINAWRCFWSNWYVGTNSSVKIFQNLFYGDILDGVHVLQFTDATQMNVTQQTNNAVYDSCWVYDASASLWRVSYSMSAGGLFGTNMITCTDTTPDFVNFTSSWTAPTKTNCEGAWITKIGGVLYTFAGNAVNFLCWNTLTGTFIGNMNAPEPSSSSAPPSHFIPFSYGEGLYTRFFAFSFDDTQFNSGGVFTNGNTFIYEATQTETGFEYNAIGVV